MAGTGGQYYDSKVMAQLFGVSVRRIQQLTQDGVIETVPLKVEGRTVRRYELVPTIRLTPNTWPIKPTAENRSTPRPS